MVELRVGLEVGALVCDGDDFFDCLILLFQQLSSYVGQGVLMPP